MSTKNEIIKEIDIPWYTTPAQELPAIYEASLQDFLLTRFPTDVSYDNIMLIHFCLSIYFFTTVYYVKKLNSISFMYTARKKLFQCAYIQSTAFC